MSQENEELARRVYDAFSRGRLGRVRRVGRSRDRVHLLVLEADGGGGVYRGHDGLRELLRQSPRTFSPTGAARSSAIRSFGQTLVIQSHGVATGGGSGQGCEQDFWQPHGFATGRSSGGSSVALKPKPSKPPACRSRRCRRRTWRLRSAGPTSSTSGATWTSFSRCTTPRSSCKPRAGLGCAVTTKYAPGSRRDPRTCSPASSRSGLSQRGTWWSDSGGLRSGGSSRGEIAHEGESAGAFWFRDGKIITWQPFETHAAALEAVGLSE